MKSVLEEERKYTQKKFYSSYSLQATLTIVKMLIVSANQLLQCLYWILTIVSALYSYLIALIPIVAISGIGFPFLSLDFHFLIANFPVFIDISRYFQSLC